jgi:hypothetical protein
LATVAFLLQHDAPEVALGPAVAERLARLGVTDLALFRDRETVCLVLEGWAFDASASAEAAAAAIGPGIVFRTLLPLMRTALRETAQER